MLFILSSYFFIVGCCRVVAPGAAYAVSIGFYIWENTFIAGFYVADIALAVID